MSETNGKHGEELSEMMGNLPRLMAELTRQFIENRDLNARVQIRLRMRSLLDFVFVDTIWPANSVKKPEPGSAREAAIAMDGAGVVTPRLSMAPQIYPPVEVQAIPGAENLADNTI